MGLIPGALAALLAVATPAVAQLSTRSVQTFGEQSTSDDSIRVPVDAPAQAADVGTGAFTIEQWLRCTDADNNPTRIGNSDYRAEGEAGNIDWINGLIFLDRDINGTPPSGGGDWGASLHRPSAGSADTVVRWGAQNSTGTSLTIQGGTDVCDDAWHHVAVGRNGSNQLFIIVDGVTDSTSAGTITGSLAYPNGTGGGQDPFLVWGNEKHAFQPGYVGYLDELRAWSVTRTAQQVDDHRLTALAGTTPGLELYLRLEEGTGHALADETGKNEGALFYFGAWSQSVPSGGGGTTSTSTTSTSTTSTTSGPQPSTSTSSSSSSTSTSAPGGGTSSSTSLQPGGTTSSTTSPSTPSSSSTTSSTTASLPTSTTVPQACAGAEDCDDLDACTTQGCVAGACTHGVVVGVTGATCELRRYVDAPLCPADPPRAKVARSITRRLAGAADLLDAAAAAGTDRPRGRRKIAAALEKLAGARARIDRAAEKGRLAGECAAAVTGGLGRAEAALVEVAPGVR